MKLNSLFNKQDPYTIQDNVFKLIDKEWMLITAGNPEHFNTMTASWGTLGILWHKPIAICFIRPQRYTYEFAEKNEYFTLSFFEEKYRQILKVCGTQSGRDIDKIAETGLEPITTELNNIGFAQSRMVMECKKIYFDDIKPSNFLLSDIDSKIYPTKDYHRFYLGEIVNCFVKK